MASQKTAVISYLPLHSFFCNTLFYVKYITKTWPHTDIQLEKEGVFQQLFLITIVSHQSKYHTKTLKGITSLKVTENVEIETTPMNFFVFCCIMTQSSTLHFEWIFHLHVIVTLCICLLENTDSLSYANLPNIDNTIKHQKDHLLKITTDLTGKF